MSPLKVLVLYERMRSCCKLIQVKQNYPLDMASQHRPASLPRWWALVIRAVNGSRPLHSLTHSFALFLSLSRIRSLAHLLMHGAKKMDQTLLRKQKADLRFPRRLNVCPVTRAICVLHFCEAQTCRQKRVPCYGPGQRAVESQFYISTFGSLTS